MDSKRTLDGRDQNACMKRARWNRQAVRGRINIKQNLKRR
jgi:hypothetical protein